MGELEAKWGQQERENFFRMLIYLFSPVTTDLANLLAVFVIDLTVHSTRHSFKTFATIVQGRVTKLVPSLGNLTYKRAHYGS